MCTHNGTHAHTHTQTLTPARNKKWKRNNEEEDGKKVYTHRKEAWFLKLFRRYFTLHREKKSKVTKFIATNERETATTATIEKTAMGNRRIVLYYVCISHIVWNQLWSQDPKVWRNCRATFSSIVPSMCCSTFDHRSLHFKFGFWSIWNHYGGMVCNGLRMYPPIFIETGMHIWKGRNQISSRSSLEMIMISIQCTLNGRTVLNWGKSVWFFFLWFRFNFNAITLNANWTKRIEVNVKRWAGTSIIRNV